MTRSNRTGWKGLIAGTAFAVTGACDFGAEEEGLSSDNFAHEVPDPAPDYVVAGLTDPPAAAANGDTFFITTTVLNIGPGPATAISKTTYFLSLDQALGGDTQFAQMATVPALASGASDTQTIALRVPSGVPCETYFVIACADGRKTVLEHNNGNNCTASAGAVEVTGPDLLVLQLGEPPQTLAVGESFTIADTIQNIGTAAAPSSVVGYYLSPEPNRTPGAFRLSSRRQIGALDPNGQSAGGVTAAVPAVPPGSYFLVACADLSSNAVEADEKNNCRGTAGTASIGP